MATTKRLIEQALRTIGVLASGEEARPAEMQDGLLTLRQMLDGWSTQESLIPVVSHETITFDGVKSTYTIGEGGDLDSVAPREIKTLNIKQVAPAGVVGNLVGCWQAPLALFEGLADRLTTYGTPRYWYYEEHTGTEFAELSFSSTPQSGDQAVIASLKPLSANLVLTEDMELPAVYEAAIRWNLAVDLAPEYGKEVSAVTATKARDSLRDIKRMNHRPMHAKIDGGITNKKQRYDINSGHS